MILCLDCGNTRVKWGLHTRRRWHASGALAHAEVAQLAGRIGSALPAELTGSARLRVLGCNVAGAECAGQIETVLPWPVQWIASMPAQCGVRNGYDSPAQLGADRWAALIGAHALHAGPALVVLAGTATTIDVLGADGQHRGGLILPGIALMASSLASGTARLPLASGAFQPLPRNTHDAIFSGAVQATLGAIQRMSRMLPCGPETICLLSGGAAPYVQPHLDLPCRHVEHLVLEGLIRLGGADAESSAYRA